jgi:hypothetical protein
VESSFLGYGICSHHGNCPCKWKCE